MRFWKRKRTNRKIKKVGEVIGNSDPDMVTIRATCNDCGDVKMMDHDVTLRICLDNNEASFRFHCPNCKRLVMKTADAITVQLLSNTGVRQERWTFPLELSEPRPGGEQLTHDDLLSMHELLREEDWLEELYREGETT